jgi:hypothetical protein
LAYVKELNHVGKLDDRSTPGVFIGYAEGTKAYRILDPKTRRVRVARDVVFDEGRGWDWSKATTSGTVTTQGEFTVEYMQVGPPPPNAITAGSRTSSGSAGHTAHSTKSRPAGLALHTGGGPCPGSCAGTGLHHAAGKR